MLLGTVLALHTTTVRAECAVIGLFSPVSRDVTHLCDGDRGGSTLRVRPSSLVHTLVPAPSAETIELFIKRKDILGNLRVGQSYVRVNGVKTKYSNDPAKFREYFAKMLLIVGQFEVGNCPVDSKNQKFPQLASVRGSLEALAALFFVRDCLGPPVKYWFVLMLSL